MTDRPVLTAALAAFDRHVPLFTGAVPDHPDFRIDWLDVGMTQSGRHGLNRHARMLHDSEFDIAEVSLASYIMARDRGAPFTAVPVFPRRLFSAPCLYLRADSDIRHPSELAGKRVAIRAFQVTLSVQAKGDLAREYGVPWRSVHWFTRERETIAWAGTEDLRIDPIPEGHTVGDLLASGELDAMIDPFPPPALLADGVIRRLFADPVAESAAYLRRHGYFPIMHLLAVREETMARWPQLGAHLVSAWEDAKRQTLRAYNDPAYSLVPVLAPVLADQRRRFGEDPWPSGLAPNEQNLNDFMGYMVDQRLIERAWAPRDLFHPSTR